MNLFWLADERGNYLKTWDLKCVSVVSLWVDSFFGELEHQELRKKKIRINEYMFYFQWFDVVSKDDFTKI